MQEVITKTNALIKSGVNVSHILFVCADDYTKIYDQVKIYRNASFDGTTIYAWWRELFSCPDFVAFYTESTFFNDKAMCLHAKQMLHGLNYKAHQVLATPKILIVDPETCGILSMKLNPETGKFESHWE